LRFVDSLDPDLFYRTLRRWPKRRHRSLPLGGGVMPAISLPFVTSPASFDGIWLVEDGVLLFCPIVALSKCISPSLNSYLWRVLLPFLSIQEIVEDSLPCFFGAPSFAAPCSCGPPIHVLHNSIWFRLPPSHAWSREARDRPHSTSCGPVLLPHSGLLNLFFPLGLPFSPPLSLRKANAS